MLGSLRDRVVDSTTSLFSHGPRPLEHTLDHRGDPGLLGPGSVSWSVIGDVAAFVGGIRALLVQTALPEVVAGVEQHSRYRDDPLGRLSRTAAYVTATTYGSMPEVEEAVGFVSRAHVPVQGRSERDRPYSADAPGLAAWVHNALTDSFLEAYLAYGPRPLSASEADRFVAEQARVGELLGADPMPDTAEGLHRWIATHPEVAPSAAQREAVGFLRSPPLPLAVRPAYRLLFDAAVLTLPPRIRETIGVSVPRFGWVSRAAVKALRWALGSSPSWHLALVRCDAPVPEGLFRQPLPEQH